MLSIFRYCSLKLTKCTNHVLAGKNLNIPEIYFVGRFWCNPIFQHCRRKPIKRDLLPKASTGRLSGDNLTLIIMFIETNKQTNKCRHINKNSKQTNKGRNYRKQILSSSCSFKQTNKQMQAHQQKNMIYFPRQAPTASQEIILLPPLIIMFIQKNKNKKQIQAHQNKFFFKCRNYRNFLTESKETNAKHII